MNDLFTVTLLPGNLYSTFYFLLFANNEDVNAKTYKKLQEQ